MKQCSEIYKHEFEGKDWIHLKTTMVLLDMENKYTKAGNKGENILILHKIQREEVILMSRFENKNNSNE